MRQLFAKNELFKLNLHLLNSNVNYETVVEVLFLRMKEEIVMEKWKTIKSEYHYKSPFGNLRKDTCQLPNGIIINDYYVQEYSDWVNAIVLTKENEVVFVEQYRYPGQDFFLEIPAGKIEEGETYEEGILREVREETGFSSFNHPY